MHGYFDQNDKTQLIRFKAENRTASRPMRPTRTWLAAWWMQRGGAAVSGTIRWQLGNVQRRFQACLRLLPRRTRRALRTQRRYRRWAATLAAVALLLALSRSPVRAATITVANGEIAIADNGICSLKEALENANDTATGQPHADCVAGDPAGADTISLPVSGSFILTSASGTYYDSPTGLPLVSGQLTIAGNGSSIRRLGSASGFRLLAVASSGDLTLRSLTVRGGVAGGAYGGGAVVSFGRLTLDNSTFSNNEAQATGGAVSTLAGTVTMNGSLLNDNVAREGGGLFSTADIVTITASSIENNESIGSGRYYDDGRGAGLFLYGGTATLDHNTISGNTVNGDGAGLFVYDTDIVIKNSLLVDNDAASAGGGVNNNSSRMTIVNSTLSGNVAGAGGGVANVGIGEVVLIASTLTANHGYTGGGLSNQGGNVVLRHSLLSGNQANKGSEVHNDGTFVADAYNLFGHSGYAGLYQATAGSKDLLPAAALTTVVDSVLRDNGGPLPTHALVAGSPAVDAVPSAWCATMPVGGLDQRGRPRNVDRDGTASPNECDVGAFEQQAGEWPVATIVVLNGEVEVVENGRCSLIEAIENANDLVNGLIHDDCAAGSPAGSDVIQLPEGGAFGLTTSLVSDAYPYTALPAIAAHVVIEGHGSTLGRKPSADPFRFLAVAASGSLTLNEVTLTGGYAPANPYYYYSGQDGGAIVNFGALTIMGSTLSDNQSGSGGGAVYSRGPLTVADTVFSDNQARFGGALNNFGNLTVISGSEVTDNVASYGGGGMALNGIAVLSDLTITGNSAGGNGGGLHVDFSGRLILTDSTISGNSATWGGGASLGSQASILNSEFAENEALELGGALFSGNDLTISHSVLSGNSAGRRGGAVYSGSQYGSTIIMDSHLTGNQSGETGGALTGFGRLTISGSEISDNQTGYAGGGIQAHSRSDVTISSSTIAGNRARRGGGLHSDGVTEISDSTIAGNQATEWGGGLQNNGNARMSNTTVSGNAADLFGGGILNKGGLTMTAVTLTNNTAGQRGGGLQNDGGAVSVGMSLIAGNQAAQGAEGDNLNGGAITSLGNLWGHGGVAGIAGFVLDAADLVPAVGLPSIIHLALADLGGPTPTHGLTPGSPAIDARPSASCAGDLDQRGEPRNADGDGRPSDHECDIGAFEQQTPPQRIFIGVVMR